MNQLVKNHDKGGPNSLNKGQRNDNHPQEIYFMRWAQNTDGNLNK